MYTCSLSIFLLSHRFASDKITSSNNAALAEQNNALVVTLAVTLAMVLIIQEQVLVPAVSSECDSGDSQAGETGSESVPAGKGALVSPCLAI